MQLLELVRLADAGYTREFPESSLLEIVDRKGKPNKTDGGDTLALFIVRELSETYDPKASSEDQVEEALRCMRRARGDLDNLIDALERYDPVLQGGG